MAVTAATLSTLEQLVSDMETMGSSQARDLTKSYAQAWDDVSQDLDRTLMDLLTQAKDGQISRATMAKSARLQRSLGIITNRLEDLATEAGVRITSDLQDAVDLAGKTQAKMIKTMLPADAAGVQPWSLVNEHTIDAIVNRATKQIESRTKKLPADQAKAMKRELIRGISVGSNPRQTANRIMKATQGRFEGGAARATRIARTETLDAMRAGARSVDLLNKDVLKGWRWSAQLDHRTCSACVGMHGRTFALEQPGPEGHPNCRCARMPATRSWADLGFKGVKEPPDLLPDAEKWFKGLPKSRQMSVLGPEKYAAYKSGKFPLSQWAMHKDNPGWRGSWVPARPGQARAVTAPAPVNTIARRGSKELTQDLDDASVVRKGLSPEVQQFGAAPRFVGTDEQRTAWNKYVEQDYAEMNLLKRDPATFAKMFSGDMAPYAEPVMKNNDVLEKMFSEAKYTTSKDITVVRGVAGTPGFNPANFKAGEYFADAGFHSTSTSLRIAEDFANRRSGGEEGWVFVTRVPKGADAIAGLDFQDELIFRPGIQQRVVEVDPKTRTVYSEMEF